MKNILNKLKTNYRVVIFVLFIPVAIGAGFVLSKSKQGGINLSLNPLTKVKSMYAAAEVNGSVISKAEYLKELENSNGDQILDSLITYKLAQDEIAKNKIQVSDKEVDAKIKEISATVPGGNLEAALADQGMTMEKLRTQVKISIGLERLVAPKVTITDEEVAAFVKENGTYLQAKDDEGKKTEAREQIKQQKINTEIGNLLDVAKNNAKIVKYLKK